MALQRVIGRVLSLTMVSVMTLPASAIDREWDGSSSQIWNDAANWNPAGLPNASDNVFIRLDAANVRILGSVNVENLTMNNGALLTIPAANSGALLVDSTTTLDKTTFATVRLLVENGPSMFDFDTNTLNLLNGAELDMSGGMAQIDLSATIGTGSLITGSGIIDFSGGAGNTLNNNGSIIADGSTLLSLKRSGAEGATFDLDGTSGDGIINVSIGTVDMFVLGPLNDAFNGTLVVGNGNTITFDNGWTLDGAAGFANQLTLSGGNSVVDAARVSGLSSEIRGNVDVSGAGIDSASFLL